MAFSVGGTMTTVDAPAKPKRKKLVEDVPIEKKVALTVEEVAALLGIGRDLVFSLIQDLDPTTKKPRLESMEISPRVRRIPRKSLEKFIDEELRRVG